MIISISEHSIETDILTPGEWEIIESRFDKEIEEKIENFNEL